jgi:hypothetical protein
MQTMTRRKPPFRAGPNPRDQSEEREARITVMLERIRQHRDYTTVHQRYLQGAERFAEAKVQRGR